MTPRRPTMHRAVLVALVALVLCSLVVSVVDADFAFRPTALLLALVISVLVSGAVTYGCAAVVRVPPGTDSWLITALILYFILPGVTDAVFFMPGDETAEDIGRLCALVVAPGIERRQLLAALRERIDPVFLPRPLILVNALPRNATGKLTRDSLQAFYAAHKSDAGR